MKDSGMDLNLILSSVITAAAIMIAVAIPFIINSVSDYNRKKEKKLFEMKAYYYVFNSYREFIYYVFQIDFWKNNAIISDYNKAVLKGDKNEISILIKNNEFLTLFQAFKYISDQYSKDIVNNSKRIFTYSEISIYQKYAKKIWYSIESRTDFKKEIKIDKIEKLEKYQLGQIQKAVLKISKDYSFNMLTIDIIANISGDMELSVIDDLSVLTYLYEQPINSIIKLFYGILSVSLIFGVIIPLLLLLLKPVYTYSLVFVIVVIVIMCFTAVTFFTGRYIGFFK